MQGGRDLPAQGTIKLSSEAYKVLAHRAIDAELRLNQLLDAIILHTDWEKDLPALVTAIKEHRSMPEPLSEKKPEKLTESSANTQSVEKVPRAPRIATEHTKTQESLGKFTSEEETRHAEPS
jgi:hypothetical protein